MKIPNMIANQPRPQRRASRAFTLIELLVVIAMPFPFGDCRVLSLDALIASKQAGGRDKDPRALRFLRAIKDKPKSGGSAPSQPS